MTCSSSGKYFIVGSVNLKIWKEDKYTTSYSLHASFDKPYIESFSASIAGSSPQITAVAITKDDVIVLTGSAVSNTHAGIKMFDTRLKKCVRTFENFHKRSIQNIQITNDHKVISCDVASTIAVWDFNQTKPKFYYQNSAIGTTYALIASDISPVIVHAGGGLAIDKTAEL
eukprot:CAMPEP_0114586782 /NCGR_PEP_ID=MMETSP0125-20121206/9913_1 /TAXON_ID=485358 ORGANISM="Aristerostoma sp., Strain ATCC 50986" /NCGR_SAMPLE_ID=MMETSP0125 /ASSEMBLY_ACC=CAM_ASM_000245 /LENGTH=170 /DNA_ID=CAMNT_0001782379 /DNA_START=1070 /DNA_END=1582 /DNA_ORIENTATION=+